MERRRFLKYAGLTPALLSGCASAWRNYYFRPAFGNATILHLTDCHAQLLPGYYREPAVKLAIGAALPQLSGEQFLRRFGIKPQSREAYAFTHLDFVDGAKRYGRMGGFAHLATLVKAIRDARGQDDTLLLDGGDSWQGSATALWTGGEDMIEAANQLGVDAMTGHWEFTYGQTRVRQNLLRFKGSFLAQNVALTEEAEFADNRESDELFKPYLVRQLGRSRVAVIGQAYPFTPIANPRRWVPDWRFGIEETRLQVLVDLVRSKEAVDVVILLSHNGVDIDLKLASRVSGVDLILGGHTHDPLPEPLAVPNSRGITWVTNAGSHGKYLGVTDLKIENGRLRGIRYQLLPVFSELLEPDSAMQGLINRLRAPYRAKLAEPLAAAETLLYRRDTYYGTFDALILDALRAEYAAEIALSPGFRWGTTVLPGQPITLEDVMSQTAITYPQTYSAALTGEELKNRLEDIADNVFNADPYYRQGGDMVRAGGLRFSCNPAAGVGRRIDDLRLEDGRRIEALKRYQVAGWAPVAAPAEGKAIYDIVATHLRNSGGSHEGV